MAKISIKIKFKKITNVHEFFLIKMKKKKKITLKKNLTNISIKVKKKKNYTKKRDMTKIFQSSVIIK